ncbi:hypothetical protein PHLCEN_2v9587 [Hermanssonia centrifuga]|uniref:Uncharacterized protein n=1 Tax=Hermanssonia centrifuga TaxID=98765 RepID=A0A2R6NQA5_9APHY|nr:hypothetical protein PHLCEN_2v9587 [Hermanssonia centrifuga]
MSAPISAISEDVLNHEHDVQQSGSMIRRVSWDVKDGRQAESDISEKTSPMSRHASSTMAAYGGPHSDPPSSSSIFGCSAAMPSEVAFFGPPISGRRPRQEEDGGVRIAGGRPGDRETSSLHTLPPPYNDYL